MDGPGPSDGGLMARVGVWGERCAEIAEAMASDSDDVSYTEIPSIGDRDRLAALDCLIASVGPSTRRFERLQARIASRYPGLPVLYLVEHGETPGREDFETKLDRGAVLVVGDSIPRASIERECNRLIGLERRNKASRSIRITDRAFVGFWALALLTYGVGDLVTTAWGVTYAAGIRESNPIVAALLDTYGAGGFLVLKTLIFLLLLLLSLRAVEEDKWIGAMWPPVVATLIGTALTVWNLIVIFGIV